MGEHAYCFSSKPYSQHLDLYGLVLSVNQVPEGYHGYPRLYNREEHFELVGKLQMDLATLALSCGMTRVIGLQWSHPVSPTRMAWTGSSQRHHDASH